MPKYIDAERLKLCFHKNVCGDAFDTIIDMQPAVDVREDTRGLWIEDDYGYSHCTECGYELDHPEEKTQFCPGCGANMEPDDDEPGTRQQAEWKAVFGCLRCSQCNHAAGLDPHLETQPWASRFCPSCGAAMVNAGEEAQNEDTNE